MPISLNPAGVATLNELVQAGAVDTDSALSATADNNAAMMGDPPDIEAYGRAFLGIDADKPQDAPERYAYQFAQLVDGRLVAYTKALESIATTAAEAGHDEIAAAAKAGAEGVPATGGEQGAEEGDSTPPDDGHGGDPDPPDIEGEGGLPARALLFKAPAGVAEYRGQRVLDFYAGDILHREAQLAPGAVDLVARTVDVAFSSTAPVDRFFGDEILDHSPTAVRLGRLLNGAPVLVNHEPADHVGVVIGESVRIETDGRGRARLRFGRSERAQEILQDIADGIRCHVSVGYRVWDAIVEQNPGGRELVRVTDWEPLEITIASVPADATVGVGRALIPSRTRSLNHQKEKSKMPDTIPINETEVLARDRQRTAALLQMGEKHGALELARQYVAEGKTEAELGMALLERMGTPQTLADVQERTRLDMPAKDVERYSLFRVIEAQLTGDWRKAGLELEAHRAILAAGLHHDRKPRGTLVPQDVLAFRRPLDQRTAVTYASSGPGATLVGTDHLAGSYIDALRARSVLAANGAQILDGLHGNVSIPRLSTDATVVVVGEGGTITESAMAWLALTLQPWTASAKQPISRRMLQQSSPAVEALVTQAIAKAIALKLDFHGLVGTGSSMPRGILYTSGVGSVEGGDNGALVTWAHLVALETAVAVDNADVGSLRYITSPSMRGYLKTKEKASGTAVYCWGNGNEVNGYPGVTSTQVPTTLPAGTAGNVGHALMFGNVNDVLMGLWGMLDVAVDTTTRDDGGIILKAYQDHDVGLLHAESMAVMNDGLVA